MNAQEARTLSEKFDVKQAAEKWIETFVNNAIKNRASDGLRTTYDFTLPPEHLCKEIFHILSLRGYKIMSNGTSFRIKW